MSEQLLPTEFADLEPYAAVWCLATETERYDRRLNSTMAEMQRFYDAITARAEDALTYCDKFALDELPEDAKNLMYLLYSMVQVSFPVEVWRQPRIPDTGAASLTCVLEPSL
ncbi:MULTISPECIES: hypothetical protein [Nocardia]|uniref:hypothetical protein n=1 Tax=Nocardia TaxID=1817 RepID=UPI0015EF6BBB|nr:MULTISPECIES: hypothetical protein [Nocardia]MCA2207743.1 hypothetical protein [Nocardia rosealba]